MEIKNNKNIQNLAEDLEGKIEKISHSKKTKSWIREKREFKGSSQEFQMFQKVRMEKVEGRTF